MLIHPTFPRRVIVRSEPILSAWRDSLLLNAPRPLHGLEVTNLDLIGFTVDATNLHGSLLEDNRKLDAHQVIITTPDYTRLWARRRITAEYGAAVAHDADDDVLDDWFRNHVTQFADDYPVTWPVSPVVRDLGDLVTWHRLTAAVDAGDIDEALERILVPLAVEIDCVYDLCAHDDPEQTQYLNDVETIDEKVGIARAALVRAAEAVWFHRFNTAYNYADGNVTVGEWVPLGDPSRDCLRLLAATLPALETALDVGPDGSRAAKLESLVRRLAAVDASDQADVVALVDEAREMIGS